MNQSAPLASRHFRSGFLLFLCLLGSFTFCAAHARTITVTLELEHLQYSIIDPNYLGSAYYTLEIMVSSDVAPLTYDEVDSPTPAFVGTETGTYASYFGDLPSLLDAITNGSWTLTVNKGDPSQQQYTFEVSVAGITTNDFPPVQIETPSDGNLDVATNSPFFWSGPESWNGLDVLLHNLSYSFYMPDSFPPSATSWPHPPGLPAGTNEFEVTYDIDASPWFTISAPTNNLAQPFTNWVSGSRLAVFDQSGFVVNLAATNSPISLGEALNAPQWNWTTFGNADWFSETTNTYDGVAAAQSGVIKTNQTSTLETTITITNGQFDLFFYWQVVALDDDYFLDFYIDGEHVDELNGAQSWYQDGPFTLGSGTHTLKWVASIDSGGTDLSTNDSGQVDEVTLDPIPTIQASDFPNFGNAPLTVQFTSPSIDNIGEQITGWYWQFGDGASTNLQNPTHTYINAGTYKPTLEVFTAGPVSPTVTGPNSVTIAALPLTNFTTNLPGSTMDFTYNNFLNPKSLQFLGSATNVVTSDGPVIQLTTSAEGEAGAVWSAAPISLTSGGGFSTFFSFRLSDPGGLTDVDGVEGGDGIAFLLQSAGYVVGTGGGGIGYDGISNSLDIEFDTFDDGTNFGVPGDINGNHVAININGVLNDPITVPIADPMNNGKIWYTWIDYEGVSQDLEVRLSETPVRPLTNILAAQVNLPAILGTTNAFVGFTAGTGAAYNEQDILAWKFMALPVTRMTGSFSLTNTPPGFEMTNSVLVQFFAYTVGGNTFTNDYMLVIDQFQNDGGFITYGTQPYCAVCDVNLYKYMAYNATGFLENQLYSYEQSYYNLLGSYANSGSVGDGAVINTYNNNTSPEFLNNTSFDNVFQMPETTYVSAMDQANTTPPPVYDPPAFYAQFASGSATVNGNSAPLPAPTGQDYGYDFNSYIFSTGTLVGTMTARQQIIESPPMPLVMFSTRSAANNFLFDFVTVSNQSYTVWSSPALTAPQWTSYSNVIGDGYVKIMTIPLTNTANSFYRLSSP